MSDLTAPYMYLSYPLIVSLVKFIISHKHSLTRPFVSLQNAIYNKYHISPLFLVYSPCHKIYKHKFLVFLLNEPNQNDKILKGIFQIKI